MFGLALWIFCADEELRTPPPRVAGCGGGTAVGGAVAAAMAAADDARSAPTPGDRVARVQAELLTRDRFVTIFTPADVDDLGINWDIFSDPARPFDDPAKRRFLRSIKTFLSDQAENFSKNAEFNSLYDNFLRMEAQTGSVHKKRLEEHTTIYFGGLFVGAPPPRFGIKPDGDQLGVVAIVSVGGRNIRYFVKTHAAGLKAERSAAAGLVSAIELMGYQILHLCGVGPEPHFFGRDGFNFYIATKDAGFEGPFIEYAKIKASAALQAQHWGCLTTLGKRTEANAALHATIEPAIASDPIAQNFIQQIVILDLLARILQLEDLQTNGTNFGFVSRGGALPLLRVVDFRFSVRGIFDRRMTQGHFDGLLAGNSSFPHLSADKAMCYALRNRPEAIRIEQARAIWAERFLRFRGQVDEATALVIHSINRTPLGGEEKAILIDETNTYAGIVKHNWGIFDRGLRDWRPEAEEGRDACDGATSGGGGTERSVAADVTTGGGS